jgi:hypothetical protein
MLIPLRKFVAGNVATPKTADNVLIIPRFQTIRNDKLLILLSKTRAPGQSSDGRSLRQQGIFCSIVAGFSPAGRKNRQHKGDKIAMIAS